MQKNAKMDVWVFICNFLINGLNLLIIPGSNPYAFIRIHYGCFILIQGGAAFINSLQKKNNGIDNLIMRYLSMFPLTRLT